MLPDFYNAPGEQINQIIRNPFPAIADWFKSATSKAQPGQLRPNNGFYQVGEKDTGMDQVAQNLNVPLQTLVQANGMKSLPPTGSYIATQPSYAAPPQGFRPTAQYGTTPTGIIQGQGGYTNAMQGVFKQAESVNASFSAFNEQYRLTGKFNDAALPQGMTLDTVKQLERSGFFSNATDAEGNAMTPAQALASYGYTFQNGVFTKTGASGSASGGGPGPGQAGYNPSGNAGGWTLARNRYGRLVWTRGGKHGGGGQRAVAENAAGTPSTVLDIQLQGG